jgi:hypothetical protein
MNVPHFNFSMAGKVGSKLGSMVGPGVGLLILKRFSRKN